MSYIFNKCGYSRITKKDIEEKTEIRLTPVEDEENSYEVKIKGNDEVWGVFNFETDGDDEVLTDAGYHSAICPFLQELCRVFEGTYFTEGDEIWYDIYSKMPFYTCQAKITTDGIKIEEDTKTKTDGPLKLSSDEEKAAEIIYAIAKEYYFGIWDEESNTAKKIFIEKLGKDAFQSTNEKIKQYYSNEIYSKVFDMLMRDDMNDTKII